jgi:hypothetical protein
MAPKLSKRLSEPEFASLLTVGKTRVNGPPAVIPAEHSARLIRLAIRRSFWRPKAHCGSDNVGRFQIR